MQIANNITGSVLHLAGTAPGRSDALLQDCLVALNVTADAAIRTSSASDLTLESCTLAGNVIDVLHAISAEGTVALRRSILFQRGKVLLGGSGPPPVVAQVLASETTSLAGGTDLLERDPRFIAPEYGDFRLRAASPAIDFAPTFSGSTSDLDGVARNVDLPMHPNRAGPRDLGAFERTHLPPLLLNGDFDRDERHWLATTAPVSSSWDATENASGPAGSGSLVASFSSSLAAERVARTQCIHVPAPGSYRLDGFGRTSGALLLQQAALLRWEFRVDGGEACVAGAATRSGEVLLATGSAWSQATAAGLIQVSAQEWTANSSIAVALVLRKIGGAFPTVSGRFDGIALSDNDLLFADGFD